MVFLESILLNLKVQVSRDFGIMNGLKWSMSLFFLIITDLNSQIMQLRFYLPPSRIIG